MWILRRQKESSSQDGEDMTVCGSWCYIAVITDSLPCAGGFSGQWLRMRVCKVSAYLFFTFC